MGALTRLILAAAGALATLLVASDAVNFGVVQGMIGVGLVAVLVVVMALWRN